MRRELLATVRGLTAPPREPHRKSDAGHRAISP
jgi:hypothetical protein